MAGQDSSEQLIENFPEQILAEVYNYILNTRRGSKRDKNQNFSSPKSVFSTLEILTGPLSDISPQTLYWGTNACLWIYRSLFSNTWCQMAQFCLPRLWILNLWIILEYLWPKLSQRKNQDGWSGQFKMYSNIRWYMLFIAELYSCWRISRSGLNLKNWRRSPPIFRSTEVVVVVTSLRWQRLTQTCATGLIDDSSRWLNPNWQFLVHSIYRMAQF